VARPAKGLGLNSTNGIDPEDALDRRRRGRAWVREEGRPRRCRGRSTPSVLPARLRLRVTYRGTREPLGRDCGVFVHCLDAQGHMRFQADHAPSVATAVWNGRVEYTKLILTPLDVRARRVPHHRGPL
jgi:hypothetical protein